METNNFGLKDSASGHCTASQDSDMTPNRPALS